MVDLNEFYRLPLEKDLKDLKIQWRNFRELLNTPAISASFTVMDESINKTILDRAKEATDGRMKTYGHPIHHFSLVGKLWEAYLGISPITPETVALMMILFKVARETLQPTKDTKTDIAGYARNLEMLEEKKEDAE